MISPTNPTHEAEELAASLQRRSYEYFLRESSVINGLVRDNTREGAPASIAVVGLGLACHTIAAERGWIARSDAAGLVLKTLRFFWEGEQSRAPRATGYKGFFYHFLDMLTGCRHEKCELSTVDSTFVFAGALSAKLYFGGENETEQQIRALADALYRRADWQWALNRRSVTTPNCAVSHGWRPERGFLRSRWQGYNEATLLYALALGSPTFPIPVESYRSWLETYTWKKVYGIEHIYAGPLFIHQLSHAWIDFRGIQDAFTREKEIDYFENSRRATYVQREYAIRNPRGFLNYGKNTWGITASDGPGRRTQFVDGREREFFGYRARGAPWGLDDGTLSPSVVAASLPFAPEIVFPALVHMNQQYSGIASAYGFKSGFNETYSSDGSEPGWISASHYGLDQGPIVIMIENYRSGFLWRLMCTCPYLFTGLRRAGFRGGWLLS